MPNELVRDSRAGDEFHYRWAARRCLELLMPQTFLRSIYLEGSSNESEDGEYVLDVVEVYDSQSSVDKIGYQLKYTTKQINTPFSISHFETTLSGFAKNFKDTQNEGLRVEYAIITNRPISEKIKTTLLQVCSGEQCRYPSTYNSLLQYTALSKSELIDFCKCLKIIDNEGDLAYQNNKLQFETAIFLVQNANNSLISTLVSMVRDKAISSKNHEIMREDVLVHFGDVSSVEDLFPAQSIWDCPSNWIARTQYSEIKDTIAKATHPVILHAHGGVGKTVVMRQLYNDIPKGSIALIYDCFGAGQYRNPATPRHRHRDALVQLSNELAQKGLCNPLISRNNDLQDQYLYNFWSKITEIINDRRRLIPDACLYLFIDAADNAEMIAQERNEECFVHDLLQSDIPEGCKLILSCRSERIEMLGAYDETKKISLASFDDNETFAILKGNFDKISIADAKEVNSFTGGNPRIIANLLSESKSIDLLRISLSPNSPKTMNDFLDNQITDLINCLQKKYPSCEYAQFTTICQCLALLPPSIPVNVLAIAANVPVALIESFIADLGYPLWHNNDVVHFRDEPTETWFRDRYGKLSIDLSPLIDRITPLGEHFAYVAETLPQLLYLNGSFDELMRLAASKSGIPQNNPTESRIIYLLRLEYAVRSAIKLERYSDVFRLAFLAGEEMAGKDRQDDLLQNYLPLTAKFLSKEEVQRLAWSKKFKSTWRGSATLYSSALLSFYPSSKDSAKGLLRSARHWLSICFENREKENPSQRETYSHEYLTAGDIYIFALAVLNISGPHECANFIGSWSPASVIFETSILIAKYLVDINDITGIEEFVSSERDNPYLVLAVCHELTKVNQFLKKELLVPCLDILSDATHCLKVQYNTYDEQITSSIIAFCESASHGGLEVNKILKILDYHYLSREHYSHSDHNDKRNRTYLKAFVLHNALTGIENDHNIIINEFKDPEKYKHVFSHSELERITEELTTLLPWYELRCNLIQGADISFEIIEKKYRTKRGFHYYQEQIIDHERSILFFNCIAICKNISIGDIAQLCTYQQDQHKLYIQDYVDFSRVFYRNSIFIELAHKMSAWAVDDIKRNNDELDVTEEATYYADIAAAICCYDENDAQVYFETAIETVSKYGEDMMPRWNAITALALRAADTNDVAPHILHRFAQCADFIRSKVVRDKYFDRSTAFSTLFKMSPTFAIATFSRRRDRNIGYFEEELIDLLENCLSAKLITSDVAWNFRGFIHGASLCSLAEICLKNEPSQDKCQIILTSTVDLLVKDDTILYPWEQLDKFQAQYNCFDSRIKEYITALQEKENRHYQPSLNKDEKKINWDNFINQIDFTPDNWLSDATKRYHEEYSNGSFPYNDLFSQLLDNKAYDVLKHIANEQNLDYYDTIAALKSYPLKWRAKPSIQRDWQMFLGQIAQKFAKEFAISYSSYHDLLKLSSSHDDLSKNLLVGLSHRSLYDENYFAMIQHSTSLISPVKAESLLEFGISRFEEYIPADFGDGSYSSILLPSENIIESLAGLIWSALGSPDLKICWDAAHSVVNYFDSDDTAMIVALFKCFENKKMEAFGSPQYPFYEFNAVLYFLIALVRVTSESIENLVPFKDVIMKTAQISDHILIKKFASEIICRIEKIKNNDVAFNEVLSTRSKLPLRRIASHADERIASPWHLKNEINKDINFLVDYDIKNYWLTSLGRVFGISKEQMVDLLKEIIVNFRKGKFDGSLQSDPRTSLWDQYGYRNRVYHSHGSSPDVQPYEFYLCYHGIMILADKLLRNLPVVQWGDESNRWKQWLSYHILTRSDGKWLADRRDAIPMFFIASNDLLSKCHADQLADIDINTLVFLGATGTISIYGNWDIKDYENRLSCKINCALISPSKTKKILNGLSMIENPYEYRVPMYSDGCEILETPKGKFYWTGIIDNYAEVDGPKIDAKDSHCSNISYPPHGLGEEIINEFNLISDSELRHWQLPNGVTVIDNVIWSSGGSTTRDDVDSDKQGELVNISIAFLRDICVRYKKSLIIEVILMDYSKTAKDNDRNMRTSYFVFSEKSTAETLMNLHIKR